ncbi:MAG: DUF1080 domain-containing protein [Saprospiraceae bacterium]|nr:DUF1080 domain-containing protein [Saprospiraceae bacterium]
MRQATISLHRLLRNSFLLFCAACTILEINGQSSADVQDTHTADLIRWNKSGEFSTQLKDGVFTIHPGNADAWLVSPRIYQNFRWRLEVQADNLSTSQFLFRKQSSDGGIQDDGYAISLLFDLDSQWPLGSVQGIARANWLEDIGTREWMEMEIVAVGDLLQVMVEGKKVCEVHNRNHAEGHLVLHASSGFMKIRNMSLERTAPTQLVRETIEDFMRVHKSAPQQQLFDGVSLAGWTQTGEATWNIKDGVLHGYSGEKGGFLISDSDFKNFYLSLGFKIAKEHNSGIFIRKPLADSLPTLQNSLECNVYDHNGLSHLYSTGSIATHARAPMGLIEYDQWNHMEIFAFEDHICLFINGKKASEAHLPAFNHPGQICLQGGIQIFADGQPPSYIAYKDIILKDFGDIPFPGH